MLICYKTFLDENWKTKTYSSGQVILEKMKLSYDDVMTYIDQADKVEKFVYGIELFFDTAERYQITIISLYNITTKKRESPKDYIDRVFEKED